MTITAGGDDLNYIGSMTRLAFAARLAGNALTRPISSLMVGYLPVIGKHTTTSGETPFPAPTLDMLSHLGDTVSEVVTLAAGQTGATLVPMRGLGASYALGSAEPWATGMPARLRDLSGRAPFHPNATGTRAVADAIVGRLRE